MQIFKSYWLKPIAHSRFLSLIETMSEALLREIFF